MLEPDSYIVYKQQVCKVKGIIEKYYRDRDYYYLVPVTNEKLKIMLPVDQKDKTRPLMSEEEALQLINEIPKIAPLEIHSRNLKDSYQELFERDDPVKMVQIIKTTYLRSQSRIASNKKITTSDETYFEKAEDYLFSELAIVLDKSVEEIRELFKKKSALN
jgi:CarD family transcriptional regulator